MKLKRILAGVMAATVLIASGNFNFTETNEVEAAVTFYQEISSDELKAYAYTNSYANSGNDRGAAEAFDRNITTLWHQNYDSTGDGPQNKASDDNPIYIQAKFAQTRRVGKLVYRDRNNGSNIIGKYMISYANSTNVRPEDDEWTTIVTDNFLEANRPLHTVEFEPVEATHIRLTALSKQGGGSDHIVASEIYVYEIDNRSYEEIVSAKAPICEEGYEPEKAIDGDCVTSKFHTTYNYNAFDNKENWIDFNLGEVKSINSLELYYDVCADPYNSNTGKGNGRITGYEVG